MMTQKTFLNVLFGLLKNTCFIFYFVLFARYFSAFTDFPKGWYLPNTIWITIQGYFKGDATNALHILDALCYVSQKCLWFSF